MKQKLSISVEESTVKLAEQFVKEGRFRNISHALEYSLNKLALEEQYGRASV